MNSKQLLAFIVIGISLATYFFLPDSCPEAAKRCAAIFVFAASFWALDLLPVYVTSLLVVLLLCFTLAKPGGVLQMDENGYSVFLAPFSSPVLMLFFGGFVLAQAIQKNSCDRFLASRILSIFIRSPSCFLFGVMITTAFFSMWISNTAATVVMLGIVRPVYEASSLSARFKTGLLLAIPFSANIGGIATPIGTPPNALAVGFLSDYGIFISFLDWFILCLPLVLLFLSVVFVILLFFFIEKAGEGQIDLEEKMPLTKEGKETLVVMLGTIMIWLTKPIHGIPEPLTALLSSGALMALGLIDRNNIKQINWDVLILMWGGLALGVGIEKTELGSWLISSLFPDWQGVAYVTMFATLAMLLSLFISNTASAALIMPIAMEASATQKPLFAITIALMCSVAMIFPVSTPPNAIAYGTGLVDNKEMVRVGSIVTFSCYLLILLGFWWIIPGIL